MNQEDKLKTFSECCHDVAVKYKLGSTLVTGHKASYWTEASEMYAQKMVAQAVRSNAISYSREDMKAMAIGVADWKDGYTGKSDTRGLNEIIETIIQSCKKEKLNPIGEGERVFRKVSVKDNKYSPSYNTWYFVFTEDEKETQAFYTSGGWNWDDIKFSSVPKDYITHYLLEEPTLPIIPKESKTIEECKDEVAKEYDHKNWNDLIENEIRGNGTMEKTLRSLNIIIDEAIQLYAEQFKTTKGYTEILEWIDKQDNHAYKFKNELREFILTLK